MGNHRAERGPRRDTSAPAPLVGKRKAVKPARSPLSAVLPSAPIVAGIAALAVSAGGAVTVADTRLAGQTTQDAPTASAGAIAGGEALAARDSVVVSRGGARTTPTEPGDAELVEQTEEMAARYQEHLAKLRQAATEQARKIEENQWVLPLDSYAITATFGEYGLWASYHTGLDFNADSGDQIRAVANGTITSAGYDGAYGNKTVLTLDDGTEIWFCHQTSMYVSPGDTVRAGEVIGTVGTTGNVTGSHLHLEVRPGGGGPVDPFSAFAEQGVVP